MRTPVGVRYGGTKTAGYRTKKLLIRVAGRLIAGDAGGHV
jgi:hypothetical protein